MSKKQGLLAGILAGPVFVLAFLIQGALRAGYDPMRHPVSSLSLGDPGWMQVLNFLVTGALLIIFATGLWATPVRLRWIAVLVAVVGIGLIGAGTFPTDPIGAYPPGTPSVIPLTSAGIAHNGFSALFFLGLPIACLIAAAIFLRQRRWGAMAYSLLTVPVFFIAFGMAGAGFRQYPGWADFGGLMQRISLVTGFAWLGWLAWDQRRRAVD
jgi:hypothetical membrane protein